MSETAHDSEPKVGSLVKISWLDSHASSIWTAEKDIVSEPTGIQSVGKVVGINDTAVTLVQSWCDQFSEVMNYVTIPRPCIVSMKTLSQDG